jgi:hypothetical protein
MLRKKALALVNHTKSKIEVRKFVIKHRTAPCHFTRSATLNFKNTSRLVLNLVKNTTKVELMNYFDQFEEKIISPSKNAFNLAREKISYTAFKELFGDSCELAIEEGDDTKLYKGYRLFALDGTSFIVGKLEELAEFFGESTTVEGKAMCRISGIVDVLNNCIIDADAAPFSIGERALALGQMKKLAHIANALYLYDRGYWSPELAKTIIKNNQRFLMRLASNIGNTIVRDENGVPYPLRRCSFTLPNGKPEILLSNIPEEEMTDDELFSLYTNRWGVEAKYLELKERLHLDVINGLTANIVLQDIYSALYFSNLVAFICEDADGIIEEKAAGKGYKYEQKANRSNCIAILRRRFVRLFLLDDTKRQQAEFQHIVDEISRCITYIGKAKPKLRSISKSKKNRSYKLYSCL